MDINALRKELRKSTRTAGHLRRKLAKEGGLTDAERAKLTDLEEQIRGLEGRLATESGDRVEEAHFAVQAERDLLPS